ncbi:CAP domain-containing protein [Paraburkholderia phenazinium]|uniref:CAP domain-containing protein n=1 Tax=Paraburkholderia phenazinium TaxID=60549 RepID=UPI001589E48F|nr:CAP domain-containing protein [Paraburkholderia phenazinium]
MKIKKQTALTALAFAVSLVLSACGGGGGSGSSTPASTTAPPSGAGSANSATSANVSTPQYASGSAQLAAFNLLNQQRQQCGFPALTENTQLDQAAAAHATYEQALNLSTDTEVSGNPGFTGTAYTDRAVHFGFPGGIGVGGVSGGLYGPTTNEAQYGQSLIYYFLAGVYHAPAMMDPVTDVGVGEVDKSSNGATAVWASLSFANLQSMTTSGPLTFPCQGTTGVAYEGVTEDPTPPNTNGSWGTPLTVIGNPTDTIVLQSATLTDTSGHVIMLQLLDSANDPNKELQPYEASAYPTSALSPNTTYSAAITGTIAGASCTASTPCAWSRNFSFTTGSEIQ